MQYQMLQFGRKNALRLRIINNESIWNVIHFKIIPWHSHLYMRNLHKSQLSRCYFICKFAAHLHSWTAFIYASTDLLLHELVREIHLKLFFNTLSFHSSHAFTLSSFALLPFSSIPSV